MCDADSNNCRYSDNGWTYETTVNCMGQEYLVAKKGDKTFSFSRNSTEEGLEVYAELWKQREGILE
ncbi:hypothetical protein HNV12_03920 [Methanococcoides sp. SA1]|nr:hypothetical protein [Methanococcoides sp. SA1]